MNEIQLMWLDNVNLKKNNLTILHYENINLLCRKACVLSAATIVVEYNFQASGP